MTIYLLLIVSILPQLINPFIISIGGILGFMAPFSMNYTGGIGGIGSPFRLLRKLHQNRLAKFNEEISKQIFHCEIPNRFTSHPIRFIVGHSCFF